MKPEYQKFILNLRVEHMGGAVSSGHLLYVGDNGRVMDWDSNIEYFTSTTRTGRQRLLVLIHGYNNTYEQGLEALTQYMHLMEAENNDYVMLSVLWPGDGWAKALSFPTEARDADDSADALYNWLKTNVDKNASISFIAHSLGCRVAMRAAGLLAGKSSGPGLGRICLLAAAINNDCLGSTYLAPPPSPPSALPCWRLRRTRSFEARIRWERSNGPCFAMKAGAWHWDIPGRRSTMQMCLPKSSR
jgi:pimeloyl-ACP methyl ester carboxylesterase